MDEQQQQQQQQPQPEQQPQHQQQPPVGGDGGGPPSRLQRLIRVGVAAIQCVLLLELAAMGVRPLLARRERESDAAGDGSSEDALDPSFDPADVLVDYFSGRRGVTALQALSTQQLQQAADNLVTEDYMELGVTDGGAELRSIVADIIHIREHGPPQHKEERVGLGKLGPLRFSNPPRSSSSSSSSSTAAASAAGVTGGGAPNS